MKVCEVLPRTDHVAFSHAVKQRIAKHSHDEEDEHQQNKHVDQRRDRHLDGFEQRLQALVLASKTQHATNSENSEDTSKLGSNREQARRLLLTTTFLHKTVEYEVNAKVDQARDNHKEVKLVPTIFEVSQSVHVELDRSL